LPDGAELVAFDFLFLLLFAFSFPKAPSWSSYLGRKKQQPLLDRLAVFGGRAFFEWFKDDFYLSP